MPQDVKLYKLLISCPGDVKDEINIIKDAVEQFNELYSDALGITIQTKYWHKSSYAQSGGKPQELLNQQFVNDCDAAVAIFWTRFGTPTDNYGSGTEEEIETMLKSGKQVFLYFSDKPIPPSMINSEGYDKIQELKDKYTGRGLYWTYSTNEGFKELFFAHLSQYFLSEKRVSEIKSKHSSALKLCCIDDKNCLKEEIIIQPFCFNTSYSTNNYKAKIKEIMYKIEQIKIESKEALISSTALFKNQPVNIEINDKSCISDLARKLNVELSDTFFNLGNLSRNPLSGDFLQGHSLDGTKEEKDKYRLIKNLVNVINDLYNWEPIEDAFKNMNCIKLALQNNGTIIDEDVEVSLTIPQDFLLLPVEYPKLKYLSMKYITTHYRMRDLFGIAETAYYSNYDLSKKDRSYSVSETNNYYPGLTQPNYEESYYKGLKEAFFYSIFPEKDMHIVKLKFDYIKHNTAIAFPTIFFINENLKQIPYKITSKNNPSIVEGILTDI